MRVNLPDEPYEEETIEQESTNPKEIKNWTDEEIRIANKNSLRDRVCENCKFSIQCSLANNRYNTCYKHKEDAGINNVLRIIRLGYPTMIRNEVVAEFPT